MKMKLLKKNMFDLEYEMASCKFFFYLHKSFFSRKKI